VCVLLGGRFGEDYPLYRAISQGTPHEMRESVKKYKVRTRTNTAHTQSTYRLEPSSVLSAIAR
jgi:hypothetical protein